MQALVIGLGQFGMTLAHSLTQYGADVIAVDHDEARVTVAAEFAAEALQLDAKDEAALASLAPDKRDLSVCAIGEEAREASILATALLRQLGAPWVVARASGDLHARILRLVGAHEVVNPERAFGQRLALRLAHRRIREVLPLGEDIVITELELPPSFVGHTLAGLQVRTRHEVTIMAIRRREGDEVVVRMPDPDAALLEGDVLLVVSTPEAARRLAERM